MSFAVSLRGAVVGRQSTLSLRVISLVLLLLGLSTCARAGTVAPLYQVGTWNGFRAAAVSYTLDDAGAANQFAEAIPIFDRSGFKVTLFTILTNTWFPGWLVLQNAASNGHEIASHTVSHLPLWELSVGQQVTELMNSRDLINANIPGQKCLTLAYPFCGAIDPSIVSQYYIAARSCANHIEDSTPKDFTSVKGIGCGAGSATQSTQDFMNWGAQAAASNGWCIFIMHGIDGGYSALPSVVLQGSVNFFAANTNVYWVDTFGNVIRYILERNNVSVTETSGGDQSITLQVTHSLDNSIYNLPVTVRRQLPTNWVAVAVAQSNLWISSRIVDLVTNRYVMFNAVPNGGDVMITNVPAAAVTAIVQQPQDVTTVATRDVTFSVQATGFEPLQYQWMKNGVNLKNGGDISGADTPTLGIKTVSWSDGGTYSVLVANPSGSVLSSNAMLNVRFGSIVLAWGDNTFGQTNVPAGLMDLTSVSAGCDGEFVLALNTNGTVVGWGADDWGQTDVPTNLNNVAAIAAGAQHCLGLRNDGTVAAWGRDDAGEADVPPGLSGVSAIAAGGAHSLALTSGGTVVAWGDDSAGQTDVPAGLTGVMSIAAGSMHSLALLTNGTVVAWGTNDSGQCTVPTGLTNVVAIAAGHAHSLAVIVDGTVVEWGDPLDQPPAVAGAVSVSGGSSSSLALEPDGSLTWWGDSNSPSSAVPPGISNVMGFSLGKDFGVAVIDASAPVILKSPSDTAANKTQTVLLTVDAVGIGPLSFQWQKNGANLADGLSVRGSHTHSLLLSNVQIADSGTYSVIVTNAAGQNISVSAKLQVWEPPVILVQPVGLPLCTNSTAILTVSAAGSAPLVYQWRKDGADLADDDHLVGSTNNNLTITGVGPGDLGLYSVRVSNFRGWSDSSNAWLRWSMPPVAIPDTIQRSVSGGIRLKAADLIANDIDSNGYSLALIDVSSNSAAGGTVVFDGSWIYYMPPPDYANSDSFSYTVTDNLCGGSAIGQVDVETTTDTSRFVNYGIGRQVDGSVLLSFDAVPYQTYEIDFTPTLSQPNWQVLTNIAADGFGTVRFAPPFSLDMGSRYYRVVNPVQ